MAGRYIAASVAAVAALVAGAVYASGPPPANTVSACYNTNSRVVTIPKTASCPKGSTSISWSRYTQITAEKPLSVAPDPPGKPLSVTLSGIIPVSHGGTGSNRLDFVGLHGNQTIYGLKTFSSMIRANIRGSATTAGAFSGLLHGDVVGRQQQTSVDALRGVPISRRKPASGETLQFNGKAWAAAAIAGDPSTAPLNISRVAVERTYAKNLTGYQVSVSAGQTPQSIAYDGAHLWVTDEGPGGAEGVTRIDLYDGSRSYFFVPLPGCDAIADTYDGSRIWVVCGDTGGNGSVPALVSLSGNLNANSYTPYVPGHPCNASPVSTGSTICRRWSPIPGVSPEAIAFDGSRLWIANEGSGNLTVVSDSAGPNGGGDYSGNAGGEGPAGADFGDILCGPDPDSTNDDGNSGGVGDDGGFIGLPSDGSPTGAGPVSILYDGSRIWVADKAAGQVVSIPDPQVWTVSGGFNHCPGVTARYSVMGEPAGVAYDSVNNAIWAVSEGDSTLTEIANENGKAHVGKSVLISSGVGPHAILFDGDDLWVTSDEGWVYEFNPYSRPAKLVSPAVEEPTQSDGQPDPCEGLAFDGTNVWCAQRYSGYVRLL